MINKKTGRPAPAPVRQPAAVQQRRPVSGDSRATAHRQDGTGRGMPVERLIRIERRKARNRAITLSILVMAIMLVTILLIIAVMKQAKPNPSLIFIQEGELAHTVQATCLIIRDEMTFTAPSAGLLKTLVTEGSRAAKGQKLAMVIPADKENQLADLQKCENDIISLQTELMNTGKVPGAQAIYEESAAALNTIVNLIRSDTSKGSLANLSAYSASIEVILEQRTTKLMTIDFKDARLDTLEAKRDSLQMTLGLDSGTLVCQQPGIVSFRMDGLESVLTPAAVDSIAAADYDKYIGGQGLSGLESSTVTKDQAILRISANHYQYLVVMLPGTDAALFKVDSLTTVSIPGEGLTIEDCRIVRSESNGTSALVVFKTDSKVERLSDRRTINAELTISATTGLKVPVSALIGYDADLSQASLMIVDGGVTRTCLVEVVDQDREYAIIKAIESEKYHPGVSTVLVVNPASIEAGEFIGE